MSAILLIILFALKAKDVFTNNVSFLKNTKVLVFITCLLIPLIYAYSIPALYFGLLKVFVLTFLGLYIALEIKTKDLAVVFAILGTSALLESILAISQFVNQGSLNGVFYYFGERSYTASSLGIAVMDTASGLLVRPYATFPHPNVLAYFLFISSAFTSVLLFQQTNTKRKIGIFTALGIIQITLLLTFSRVLIVCNAAFLLFMLLHMSGLKKKRLAYFAAAALVLLFTAYLLMFSLRFLNFSNILPDILSRNELTPIALSAVNAFPLGLGLHNFYYYQAGIQTQFSSVYLQPVHNIFLLLLAESGIICTLLFVYFLGLTLVKLYARAQKDKRLTLNKVLLALLLVSITVGMFDHYLLTIQQGQLLFTILLGLCWNKDISSHKTNPKE